jgi:hypothetical protein
LQPEEVSGVVIGLDRLSGPDRRDVKSVFYLDESRITERTLGPIEARDSGAGENGARES